MAPICCNGQPVKKCDRFSKGGPMEDEM